MKKISGILASAAVAALLTFSVVPAASAAQGVNTAPASLNSSVVVQKDGSPLQSLRLVPTCRTEVRYYAYPWCWNFGYGIPAACRYTVRVGCGGGGGM